VTGRSSRSSRSRPATKAWASSKSSATDVTEVAVGDRVAIPWLGYACGTCDHCVSGWETLCESQLNTGYSIDGGFAEYAKAHARHVVKVPAGIDPFDAAPLTCAGVTTRATSRPRPSVRRRRYTPDARARPLRGGETITVRSR
jgi:NADPH:quinone reductase-like Zn-dependent oxidoreductase